MRQPSRMIGLLAVAAALAPATADAAPHVPFPTTLAGVHASQLAVLGAVNTVVADHGTVYVGGTFSQVGVELHDAVLLDAATHRPTGAIRLGGPEPELTLSVPDGHGGFYVAGTFTSINGVARTGLAHVDGRGRLDHRFQPVLVGTDPHTPPVTAMSLSGGTLFLVGAFRSVNGTARDQVAAVDAATGGVTEFAPRVGLAQGDLTGVLADRGGVFVSGSFTRVDGAPRRLIARVSRATGALLPWDAHLDINGAASDEDAVNGMVEYQGILYTAGEYAFQRARSPAPYAKPTRNLRYDAAAFTIRSGQLTAWNPDPNNEVFTLARAGRTILLGGQFGSLRNRSRLGIGAVDLQGRVTPWNPRALDGGDDLQDVSDVTVAGETVFVDGAFERIGRRARTDFAALDLRSGRATPFAFLPAGYAPAVALSGRHLLVGEGFHALASRDGLMSLDARTGAVDAWAPRLNGPVDALAASGDRVFIGGSFTEVDGQPRTLLAAVGTTGRHVLEPWHADLSQDDTAGSASAVTTLALFGTELVAGGTFLGPSGTAQRNLVAIDSHRGAIGPWAPNPDEPPAALVASPTGLYVGGAFHSISGTAQRYIARFRAPLGSGSAPDSWNPAPSGPVLAIAPDGPLVYLGGSFRTLERSALRRNLAAVDAHTAIPTLWNPGANGAVTALAVTGQTIYAGGDFTEIDRIPGAGLRAIPATRDRPCSAPQLPPGEVNSLTVMDSTVFTGITNSELDNSQAFAVTPAAPPDAICPT